MDKVSSGLNFVSRRGAMARMPLPTAEGSTPVAPGKSASAPGQLAKVAVAAARAAGADLPTNAQGVAASQIARGADPASVFAALIPAPEPDPAPEAEPAPDTAATPEASGAVPAASGYTDAAEVVAPVQTDAEIALDLLTGGAEDETPTA